MKKSSRYILSSAFVRLKTNLTVNEFNRPVVIKEDGYERETIFILDERVVELLAQALLLLFFETAFGICIGCKIYNLFNKEKAQLCPGNVCEMKDREAIQVVQWPQALVAGTYVVFLIALSPVLQATTPQLLDVNSKNSPSKVSPAQEERCRVPEFAKKLGHEKTWKLHNGC